MPQAVPEILLGVVLAVYWGRVLRMAHKARRRAGRTPPISCRVSGSGKIIRVVWAPVIP